MAYPEIKDNEGELIEYRISNDETILEATFEAFEANPTEECLRQLRKILGHQYFGSLDELRAAVRPALEYINPPGIYQYLCRRV